MDYWKIKKINLATSKNEIAKGCIMQASPSGASIYIDVAEFLDIPE